VLLAGTVVISIEVSNPESYKQGVVCIGDLSDPFAFGNDGFVFFDRSVLRDGRSR
jgi:hypothetical protein